MFNNEYKRQVLHAFAPDQDTADLVSESFYEDFDEEERGHVCMWITICPSNIIYNSKLPYTISLIDSIHDRPAVPL